MFEFNILHKNKNARTGVFKTPHGKLLTPELAIVATDAEIRAIPKKSINKLPIRYTITNTFHTFTKGLVPAIEQAGGVNDYMGYENVTATDSGGFQVFSLGFGKVHQVGKIASKEPIITRDHDNLLQITEKGVMFSYDEKLIMFTPELSIAIQKRLGADIIFAFDECTSPLNSHEYTKKAMKRTHRWLERCLSAIDHRSSIIDGRQSSPSSNRQQALFAIVQGGMFENLRRESAKFMAKQPVSGFGIGGALGTTKDEVKDVLDWTIPLLPEEKPKHLLGIGQVRDIFESVERGVDLFDCVIPTREARHRILYTTKGKINVRKYKTVNEVANKNCRCQMCSSNLTIQQLNNLFSLKDPRAFYYATVHNIQFYSDLMKNIRDAIAADNFFELKEKYLKFYP